MNHDKAIREQAVERYLLGELPEGVRARFEEHFFDCSLCASDLKNGAMFVDALRADLQPAGFPVLPAMRRAAGVAQAPEVMNNVILATISARGSDIPKLLAPAHGSFLISVDVPSKTGYASYLCLLYNSSGKQLWQMPITAQQAENAVSLWVPTEKAANGTNELRVLALPSTGGSPVEVGRYRFSLQTSQ